MTDVTDGVPFEPIQLVTGNRITFSRSTEMTIVTGGIPNTAVVWGANATLSWGGDSHEVIW